MKNCVILRELHDIYLSSILTCPVSGVESIKFGDMEGLEGEEEDNNSLSVMEEVGEATTLTAKLQEILYDPKSYLLGDLTEEKVYSDYEVIFIGCVEI